MAFVTGAAQGIDGRRSYWDRHPEDLTEDDFRTMMEVSVIGAEIAAQEAARRMADVS